MKKEINYEILEETDERGVPIGFVQYLSDFPSLTIGWRREKGSRDWIARRSSRTIGLFSDIPDEEEFSNAWLLSCDTAVLEDDEALYFWDQGCNVGHDRFDNLPFVVVPGWDEVNHPAWVPFLNTMLVGVEGTARDRYWGFSDEYDTCSDCGALIHYGSSQSYPHWMTDSDGLICLKCTEDDAEYYIEWLSERAIMGHTHRCILSEETLTKMGFVSVLTGMRNGFHHGDADNPHQIVAWCVRNKFQPALVTFADQFTLNMDLWLRVWDEEESNWRTLTESDVAVVLEALTVDNKTDWPHLRSTFIESPSPAERAERALKGG